MTLEVNAYIHCQVKVCCIYSFIYLFIYILIYSFVCNAVPLRSQLLSLPLLSTQFLNYTGKIDFILIIIIIVINIITIMLLLKPIFITTIILTDNKHFFQNFEEWVKQVRSSKPSNWHFSDRICRANMCKKN